MKTVLYFNPHLSFPSQCGFDVNSWQVIKALLFSDLKLHLAIYDHGHRFHFNSYYKDVVSKSIESISLFPGNYNDVFKKCWFEDLIEKIKPDIIFFNTVTEDFLLDHQKYQEIYRINFIHDLDSINTKMKMWHYFNNWEKKISAIEDVPDKVVNYELHSSEKYFCDEEELELLSQYDLLLSVSSIEIETIKNHNKNVNIALLPITQSIRKFRRDYLGGPLFPMGPNIFNKQGYYFFLKKVFPLLNKKNKNFSLKIMGPYSSEVLAHPCIVNLGYVLSLQNAYKKSSFLVCPTFSGTGQQVKILEGMAYGVSPVIIKNPYQTHPISHMQNGLVANSIEEFADYIHRLDEDRNLCKSLGENALTTVVENYSERNLQSAIQGVFGVL